MAIRTRLTGGVLSALALAMLAACSGDRPDKLLASARDYLAKNDAAAAVIQLKSVLQKAPDSAEARFLLGKTLLQSGDPVGAEVELRKAMDAKYAVDDVAPLLAQALLAMGEPKKVLNELQKLALTSPDARADLQTSVAQAQAALGQIDKARASIDAALAIKPDHAATMIMKARVLLADKDVNGAVGLLDAVIAKDARNADAWRLKGDVLASRREDDAALAAYRQAVAAKPSLAGAHGAIIEVLMRQNKLDEAGQQLAEMKKAAPKSPMTFLADAEYQYQKKDYKKAQEATQELLKFAPNDPKVLLLAGSVQYQLNSLPLAEEYLTRAQKLVPASPLARRMLAVIQLRTGQPAKALATIEPMLAQGENDSALMSLAGDIYMQNGKPQKAEEYFGKAAALDPKNATKQTKVALSHFVEGKTDEAFGELERIASADAGTTADMALISAAIRKRDFGKAMAAIDGLEKKQPDNPLTHALRGVVLVAKGDVAGGRKSLEKALSIKPGYFPAAASLAALDLQDKKPDDAKKRFEAVLAADPKNIQAGLALAELKAKTGAGNDEVAGLIGKVIQSSPTEPGPRLALIAFHLQNKEAKKAVAAAQDAVAAMPDRVEMLDALARAQLAAGDTNQALAAYGKMIQLMPGSPQPYVGMAETNLAAKDKPAAIQNLRKALEVKPDFLAAQRGLIALYLDSQNIAEAQKIVTDVKKQHPNEVVGFLFEGDLAAVRKDWPAAVAAYKAGLKQVPSSELAIKAYAALYGGGNGAEAEKFAAGWLVEHPQDAGFRTAMAESAMARKDYAAGVRQYQALLQKQPNNPILLNNVAWSLGQMKDPKALDYAQKANELAPDQPAIMETLGSLLVAKGDAVRGMQFLQKALDKAPDSAVLKLSMARAKVITGRKDEARKLLDDLAKLGDKFPEHSEVTRLLKEIGN
jgi:putative PEP-CTERM system TPR-repeat lipoprotein